MYEDKILICKDCGAEFEFTAGKQEPYAEKGSINEPQRCKACRSNRKNSRGDSFFERVPREMYTIVCASCGATHKVPLQPRDERPVYCNDCFANRR